MSKILRYIERYIFFCLLIQKVIDIMIIEMYYNVDMTSLQYKKEVK